MNDPRPEKKYQPESALANIADAMLDFAKIQRPEGEPVKAIVMLSDDQNYMLAIGGYEDESTEPILDIMMQLRALLRANGKDMMFGFGDDEGNVSIVNPP